MSRINHAADHKVQYSNNQNLALFAFMNIWEELIIMVS